MIRVAAGIAIMVAALLVGRALQRDPVAGPTTREGFNLDLRLRVNDVRIRRNAEAIRVLKTSSGIAEALRRTEDMCVSWRALVHTVPGYGCLPGPVGDWCKLDKLEVGAHRGSITDKPRDPCGQGR